MFKKWFGKKKEVQWTPEQEENMLRNLEFLGRLYKHSVNKYGDDGHDQFVDLMEKSNQKRKG